jgi:nonsense-mediated mRNA decay protein 3
MNGLLCPRCGKKTDSLCDSVCGDCFLKQFTLATLPQVLHITTCSRCGATLEHGRWVDGKKPEDTAIEAAERELMIHDKAEGISLGVNVEKISPYIYRIRFHITATACGLPVEQDLETEIRVERNACDTCSRIAAGYFEGIVQIRATGRHPTEEEKKECVSIICAGLDRLYAKGDKLAFLSNSMKRKEGTDLYIGSSGAARIACRAVVSDMGGSFSESPALFGMKDGKDVYRITFALRLPRYRKGDVLRLKGRTMQVRMPGKTTRGIDLITGDSILATPEETESSEYLGNERDAVKAVLVATEKDTVMVMDPETFRTVTVRKPYFLSGEAGIEVPVLKTAYGLILLP